jgi:hypothetical protein
MSRILALVLLLMAATDTAQPPHRQLPHMGNMAAVSARNRRERKIAELIASAPPLTADQKARLAVLLSSHPVVDA